MDHSSYIALREGIELKEVSLGYRTVWLLPPEDLPQAQLGYSVSPGGESLTGEEDGDWHSTWLVIAENDESGDPLFVDIALPAMPVYTARHGEGSWKPSLVAESFASFVAALERVQALSQGRDTPVALGENPLPPTEVDEALTLIASENPRGESDFWESWLRPF
jgi:hypothetical protein